VEKDAAENVRQALDAILAPAAAPE
jgi:hypothetical protein